MVPDINYEKLKNRIKTNYLRNQQIVKRACNNDCSHGGSGKRTLLYDHHQQGYHSRTFVTSFLIIFFMLGI